MEPAQVPTAPSQPPLPVHHSHKKLFVILSVLILFLIASTSILAYQLYQANNKGVEPPITQTSQISPTPDATADWEEYVNEVHGFSFKYPKEIIEIIECLRGTEDTIFISTIDRYYDPCQSSGGNLFIQVVSNPYKISEAEKLDYNIEESELIVVGVSAKKYLGTRKNNEPAPIPEQFIVIAVPHGRESIVITSSIFELLNLPEELKYLDQILSTFRFLDEEDVSEWNTYNSQYGGVSFQYPPDWELSKKEGQISESENIELKSPSGFIVEFSPFVDGLGGGCEPEDCPIVNTYRKTPLSDNYDPRPLFLVEGSVGGKYRMGIVGPEVLPGVDKQKAFPYYLIYKNTKGENAWFKIDNYGSGYSGYSSEKEFFNQPDIQMAKKILSTIKY